MNKHLSILLFFGLLISQNSTSAFSFPQFSKKRAVDSLIAASALISIPCFKQFYDLHTERNSLLKSVLPNFKELINRLQDEYSAKSASYPNAALYKKLWNNFLRTHIEPTHPELVPQIKSLDNKSGLFFLAGTILVSISIIYFLSNYSQKNKEAVDTIQL